MRTEWFPILAIAVFSAAPTLHAQSDTALVPGRRIRIAAPRVRSDLVVGTLGDRTDSSIVVVTDKGDVTLPIDKVYRLWVSRGKRRSHAAVGALLGGVLGLGVGVALASTVHSSCQPPPGSFGCGFGNVDAGAGMMLGGVALGVTVGMAIGGGGERWQSVPVSVLRRRRVP